jgi:hypothetical protein
MHRITNLSAFIRLACAASTNLQSAAVRYRKDLVFLPSRSTFSTRRSSVSLPTSDHKPSARVSLARSECPLSLLLYLQSHFDTRQYSLALTHSQHLDSSSSFFSTPSIPTLTPPSHCDSLAGQRLQRIVNKHFCNNNTRLLHHPPRRIPHNNPARPARCRQNNPHALRHASQTSRSARADPAISRCRFWSLRAQLADIIHHGHHPRLT